MTVNEWMVLLVFGLQGLGVAAGAIAVLCGVVGAGCAIMWFFATEESEINKLAGKDNKKNDDYKAVSAKVFKFCCWVFPFALLFAALAPNREHVKYATCYFIAKQGIESFSESAIGKSLMERAAEEIKNLGKKETK